MAATEDRPLAVSVGEKLLNEIDRVSAKRQRWRTIANATEAWKSLNPAIFMMTADIDAAKAALAANDAIACINSLKALEGYDDDD